MMFVCLACFICLLFGVSVVSARMAITEPSSAYNLGDKLYVSLGGITGASSGNLNINLLCSNQTINLLKISARAFSSTQEQSYSLPYKELTKEDLEIANTRDVLGSCQITASLGAEQTTTRMFTITDSVSLSNRFDKITYNPGDLITVTVEATKANNQPLNGFLETSDAAVINKEVVNGRATLTFSMAPDTKAGDYNLDVFVYDKGTSGETLNQANSSSTFKINQVPTNIQLGLSTNQLVPGEELTISADILDQTGDKIKGAVSLSTNSSNTRETRSVNVNSGEFAKMKFATNTTPGIMYINAKFADIQQTEEFEILPLEKVDFEFIDTVLVIKNVGNVPYTKPVDVKIGEGMQTVQTNIPVGGEQKFNLKAPTGEYKVAVSDGQSNVERNILLTGKAISVKDITSGSIFSDYAVIWVFLILILIAAAAIILLKMRKRPMSLKDSMMKNVPSKFSDTLNFTNKSPEAQSLYQSGDGNDEHGIVDLRKPRMIGAESALVLKGEKTPSAVICLHVKNYSSLKPAASQELVKVIGLAKEEKGLVDWKDDFVFVIFSPISTKTFNNESHAIIAGMGMFERLNEYNKKFRDKIVFSIGITSGDLVASPEGKMLKYTALGNTIALSKRIAASAEGQLLVTDLVRNKLMRDVKADKVQDIGRVAIYSVKEIKDHTQNRARLDEMMKRMKREDNSDKNSPNYTKRSDAPGISGSSHNPYARSTPRTPVHPGHVNHNAASHNAHNPTHTNSSHTNHNSHQPSHHTNEHKK